uniref:Bestrophin homolog n=1 Tax=Chrysotila carterae TaxID=13221 RepID=A0A7S4BG64_CHRCT
MLNPFSRRFSAKAVMSEASRTVLPAVWRMGFFTMTLSLLLCHIYNPMRRSVRDGGKKTLLFYIFQDCDAFFSICTSFVTFILGFSNATVFQRWWRLRELCGTVNGKTVDTAVLISSYARRESDLDELFRLLWLAHALHVHSIHNSETDSTLDDLIQEGLLREGVEADALRSCTTLASSTPLSIVYGWFTTKLRESIIRDVPPPMQAAVLTLVQTNISAMRGAAADVLMYLSTPVPLAYTSLLEFMVTIYVLMAPLGLVPRLLWMAVRTQPGISNLRMCTSLSIRESILPSPSLVPTPSVARMRTHIRGRSCTFQSALARRVFSRFLSSSNAWRLFPATAISRDSPALRTRVLS